MIVLILQISASIEMISEPCIVNDTSYCSLIPSELFIFMQMGSERNLLDLLSSVNEFKLAALCRAVDMTEWTLLLLCNVGTDRARGYWSPLARSLNHMVMLSPLCRYKIMIEQ